MSVKALLSMLLASGVMTCAVAWAGDPPANNGRAKDAICLASLVQEESASGDAEDSSRSVPPPPPPPPPLKRSADPGYAAVGNSEPGSSPFVEEKSPPKSTASKEPSAEPAPSNPAGQFADPVAPDPTQCCPSYCPEDPCRGWRLFDWPQLNARGIEISGWLDQGITLNGYNPLNRFNGPVTFNDRANEYQMNQFYVYAERKADASQCDWDCGARVDLMYGTDYRFAVARGLEDGVNSGSRFYGMALPQFYFDLAKDDLILRLGHFYSILNHESVPAPANFFYSHSYTSQYALPFTHTGAVAMYKVSDNWSVTAGIHRGWDAFSSGSDELLDGNASLLVGLNWTSCDKRTTGSFALTSGHQPSSTNNRTAYDLYITRKIGERFTYVFEHALGHEGDAVDDGVDANWYSIANYLFYRINERWQFGVRHEWFADRQGARVVGVGDPTSSSPIGYVYPTLPATGSGSDWGELSLGVNYRPNRNFVFRSEVRFDWQSPRDQTVQAAFNDYTDLSQCLWANDVIFTF